MGTQDIEDSSPQPSFPRLTSKETKDQRRKASCPKTHSKLIAERKLEVGVSRPVLLR